MSFDVASFHFLLMIFFLSFSFEEGLPSFFCFVFLYLVSNLPFLFFRFFYFFSPSFPLVPYVLCLTFLISLLNPFLRSILLFFFLSFYILLPFSSILSNSYICHIFPTLFFITVLSLSLRLLYFKSFILFFIPSTRSNSWNWNTRTKTKENKKSRKSPGQKWPKTNLATNFS